MNFTTTNAASEVMCCAVLCCAVLVGLQRRENFPGLIYRMPEPQATIMIFNKGKFNLTGRKSS